MPWTHALRSASLTAFAALAVGLGHAQPDGAQQRLGDDLFVAGGTVTVSDPVGGDLLVAGGSVDIDAPVSGDALGVGGKLRFGVEIGRSAYVAGGQVTVNGRVGHNVRVVGGQVALGPSSQVQGNISALGGQVRLLGRVAGHLQVAGGRVRLDGPVDGDVIVTAGELTLGPNARVGGQLRYRSRAPLTQDPQAQVIGGIERIAPPPRREEAPRHRGFGVAAAGAAAVWTAGLMPMVGVLLAIAPSFQRRTGDTLRTRPGLSLLLGAAVLVGMPAAVVVLMVTLVGVPLGLLSLALYLALLPLAYASAAIGLGQWGLQRWSPARTDRLGWRIGAACVVIVLLALLNAVPVLGGLIGLLVLLAGLGALAQQLRRNATASG